MAKKPVTTIDRQAFQKHLKEIADSASNTLYGAGIELFDLLTEDERQTAATGGSTGELFRLAKTLLIVIAKTDLIEREFGAETMKPQIKKIAKINKNRPH